MYSNVEMKTKLQSRAGREGEGQWGVTGSRGPSLQGREATAMAHSAGRLRTPAGTEVREDNRDDGSKEGERSVGGRA